MHVARTATILIALAVPAVVAAAPCENCHKDVASLSGSVHPDERCVTCHRGADSPHGAGLPDPACGSCHRAQAAEQAQSRHGVSRAASDASEAAACGDCHGGHNILPSTDPNSTVYRRTLPRTCARCHEDPELVARYRPNVRAPFAAYSRSVHGKALLETGLLVSAECTDCHGVHLMLGASDPRSTVNWANINSTCGSCHFGVLEKYNASVHGLAFAKGATDAPTCIDCHGDHDILPPDDPESSVFSTNISLYTCPQCHASRRVAAKRGLDPDKVASYEDTYHGLAGRGGSGVAANCASCHGTHDIHSSADPRALTYPDSLLVTCGGCHPRASASFVSGAIHEDKSNPTHRATAIVRFVYVLMIGVLIGGMVVHNVVILVRYTADKYRLQKAQKHFVRFITAELVQHLMLALSFTMLVLTGFMLKFPDSWWVELFAAQGVTESVRGLLHRIAAGALIATGLYHCAFVAFTRRGREQLRYMLPNLQDARDAVANLTYHLRLSEARPLFDRYDYTQKSEYWALVWGTLVMVITGVVLWFPEELSAVLPGWAVDVATTIHYYEAWLATLAIIVWHFFYVIFHPIHYPMDLSWITGKITADEMEHHHTLEHRRFAESDEKGGGES